MPKKQDPIPALPTNLQAWVDVRTKLKLPHAAIQMARELSLSPMSLLTHEKRRFKAKLPSVERYITSRYRNRFGQELTEAPSIEGQEAEKKRLRVERRKAKALSSEED